MSECPKLWKLDEIDGIMNRMLNVDEKLYERKGKLEMALDEELAFGKAPTKQDVAHYRKIFEKALDDYNLMKLRLSNAEIVGTITHIRMGETFMRYKQIELESKVRELIFSDFNKLTKEQEELGEDVLMLKVRHITKRFVPILRVDVHFPYDDRKPDWKEVDRLLVKLEGKVLTPWLKRLDRAHRRLKDFELEKLELEKKGAQEEMLKHSNLGGTPNTEEKEKNRMRLFNISFLRVQHIDKIMLIHTYLDARRKRHPTALDDRLLYSIGWMVRGIRLKKYQVADAELLKKYKMADAELGTEAHLWYPVGSKHDIYENHRREELIRLLTEDRRNARTCNNMKPNTTIARQSARGSAAARAPRNNSNVRNARVAINKTKRSGTLPAHKNASSQNIRVNVNGSVRNESSGRRSEKVPKSSPRTPRPAPGSASQGSSAVARAPRNNPNVHKTPVVINNRNGHGSLHGKNKSIPPNGSTSNSHVRSTAKSKTSSSSPRANIAVVSKPNTPPNRNGISITLIKESGVSRDIWASAWHHQVPIETIMAKTDMIKGNPIIRTSQFARMGRDRRYFPYVDLETKVKYNIEKTVADGNCFFHALFGVSSPIGIHDSGHNDKRKAFVEAMKSSLLISGSHKLSDKFIQGLSEGSLERADVHVGTGAFEVISLMIKKVIILVRRDHNKKGKSNTINTGTIYRVYVPFDRPLSESMLSTAIWIEYSPRHFSRISSIGSPIKKTLYDVIFAVFELYHRSISMDLVNAGEPLYI